MRIAVTGDLTLDVLVEPAGALHAGDDTPGRIGMECGGQAANVAAWVTALGGRARLVCARASDENGARADALVRARGVEVAGPSVAGRGAVVVSIIAASGERTLVSDPGCARSLRPEHLSGDWFADCAWLHVSGYHLFDDAAAGAALRGAELARAHGARVSLDLSCAARLRQLGGGAARRRVSKLGPDLVFQTAAEAGALGGPWPAPISVVKRGADGCTVICGGEHLDLVAHPATAVDTTGAGDAFAAGFLLGDGLRSAAESGLAAAARCVSVVGAMPGDPVGMEVGSR